MTSDLSASSDNRLREHAERNLGSLVIAVEFTLISVMVGVILFPLMDGATVLLKDLRYEYWLYILSGVLLILYLWTEVITHSLSFIGWPMDMGHNLLYIVSALALGIQMHLLSDPLGWFVMTTVSAVLATAIIVYDLRVIQTRSAGATGAAAELFEAVRQRQYGLMRTTPFTIGNSILQVALLVFFPGFFIEQHGHLILVIIQILAFLGLEIRTIRAFASWNDTIVRKAMQELLSEMR